ncbi:MAG: SHOCT domain-containing protein [Desulfovibrionaceae bacterium]
MFGHTLFTGAACGQPIFFGSGPTWLGGFHFPLSGLALLLLLAAALGFVIFRTRRPSEVRAVHPAELLKRRYASGEISREQYLTALQDLHS